MSTPPTPTRPSVTPWRDTYHVITITRPECLDKDFEIVYSSLPAGRIPSSNRELVASWRGGLASPNFEFGKNAQGATDHSVITVAIDINAFRFLPPGSPIHYRITFFIPDTHFSDGYNNIIEEGDIYPTEASSIYSQLVINAMRGNDGAAGADGQDGQDGQDGADGKSAYQIAVDNGFDGTEAEWLESLKYKPTPEEQEESEQHAIEMATAAAVAAANAVIEQQASEIATLKARVDELSAAEGSESAETPAIDSQKEVNDFLNGIDNTKRLKDMLSGNVNEEEEELVFG